MITGNEPAMPTQGNSASGELEGGLTIRQHFAAMAMQALIPTWIEGSNNHKEMVASQSVELADALIAELNKKD